jgi:hypothetical protein
VTSREIQKLAERIAKHKPPPIMRRKVDQALLTRTAKRLMASKHVLRDMVCDPRVN